METATNQNVKYYIVPDVHGRTFYRNTLDTFVFEDGDPHMIFLGDYIDPYPDEDIDAGDAFDRFKYIVEQKRKYPKRITLLIGNHDLHYFDGSRKGCRMDHYRHQEITDFFIANIDMFDFTKFITVNGRNYIVSHAGFNYNWVSYYSDILEICDNDDFSDEKVIGSFNFGFLSSFDWTDMALDKDWLNRYGDCGTSRGGWCNHPSFLWADLSDHLFQHVRVADCEQIFGHTMQPVGEPLKLGNCYCLDCQEVFKIGEDGIVRSIFGSEIPDREKELRDAYEKYYARLSAFFC